VLSKVLLLEDDSLFGETLCDLLEEEGYEVTYAPNGQIALDYIYANKFDIYLFDINVPLIDGITLLKDLRQAKDKTPTIFLTSHKDKETLRKSFHSGCDDYLTKPFDNEELLLRIEARLGSFSNETECKASLCHNSHYREFRYNTKILELSKKEYELLVVLFVHANKPVSKEIIIEALWSSSQSFSEGSIRVYINRLKQCLPDLQIENIRSVGYKLVC
jgi:DNA-binding response OmpR family regulator